MTDKRAYEEAARRIDALAAKSEIAADLDAGFDSGEWSGPAHDEAFERDKLAVLRELGIDPVAFAAWENERDIAPPRPATWSDLGTITYAQRRLASVRQGLEAITDIEGVRGALALLDQLDDAVSDVAADIEMELHERRDRKGR